MPILTHDDLDAVETVDTLLCQRAEQHPDRLAFTFLLDGETRAESLTYAQLDRRARAIAVALRRYVASGERALIAYDSSLDFISAFFGCLYAGVIAVPVAVPGRRGKNRFRAIAETCAAAVTLSPHRPRGSARGVNDDTGDALPRLDVAACDLSLADEWRPTNRRGHDTAFLQFTSGSTAQPRGVVLTHDNLIHNQSVIRRAFATTSESSVFSWLPLHHDMGLIGTVIHPIFMGVPCVLMSPTHFVERPIRWLRALSHFRSTVSGGPNFAFDLCVRRTSKEERRLLDLSNWTVAFNGAETVRPETLRSFAASFSVAGFRPEAFYPCYGLAEATLFVAGRAGGSATACFDRHLLKLGTARPDECGNPQAREFIAYDPRTPGQELRVVRGDDSTVCSPGEVGEIWISGPNVAEAYWSQPQETTATFRASLAAVPDRRFLRTGDLGFITAGQLFIAGRAKDLIILRGRNLYPDDIERSVEACHPLLRRGGGVAFSVDEDGLEQLVVVHEVERKYQDDCRDAIVSAVRQAVAEHEVQIRSLVLVKIGEIPRTSSGKAQRRLCKGQFLNETLNELARFTFPTWEDSDAPLERCDLSSLSVEERRNRLLTVIRETTGQILGIAMSDVELNISPASLGLDSLMWVELQHRLERFCGVHVSDGALFQHASLTAIADQLCEAVAKRAGLRSRAIPSVGDFPLSRGQRALWITEQLVGASAPGPLCRAVSVRGRFDAPAFMKALHQLASRHSALRTTIRSEHGVPRQTIREVETADIVFVDGSNWSVALLQERVKREVGRAMPFEGGSLFRVCVIRRSDDDHLLVIGIHHGIADYWSVRLILNDLEEYYAAGRELRPDRLDAIDATYADYVTATQEWRDGDAGLLSWDFWRRELSGAPFVIDLQGDRVRPAMQTFRGDTCWCELGPGLTAGLKELARANNVTLFAVLLASYFALLHRHTGQEDILVGVPVANRRDPTWREVVGYFVNLVVMRGQLQGDSSFVWLLRETAPRLSNALAHQDLPFPTLVERLRPARDLSRHPIVQCSMVLLGDHRSTGSDIAALAVGARNATARFHDLSLTMFALEPPSTEFDLSVTIAETDRGLFAKFDYSSDLFDALTIQLLTARWKTLLDGIVARPSEGVSRLPLMPPSERRTVFEVSRGPKASVLEAPTHRLFEQQVVNRVDALVADEESALTFAELNDRANQLARYLRHLGVRAETRVGLCVGRSTAMLVGALAIMKAGGAYVALDPSHPHERLVRILEDSGASIIVTDCDAWTTFPRYTGRAIHLVHDRDRIASETTLNLGDETHPAQAAYVMHTSGSTGVPNGVIVSHQALTNLLGAMRRAPGLANTDRLLSVTTLAFDIAALELFLPLTAGAHLMIASQETVIDAARLAERIERWRPTVMQATPATWQLLLDSGWAGAPDLTVLCGGEALSNELASRLRARCAAVWNMYGPTETTIWSMTGQVVDGATVALGTPIDNTDVYVLDPHWQPVPFGVSGELFIGGLGLARGYLGRPDLTADRFVPDPFASVPGRRLYRTGDRGRRRMDGALEFLGRTDHQIKLRGFRIDPSEIEKVIATHPLVRNGIVATAADQRGDKVLVAYVVGDPSCEQALRDRLTASLPSYMVPAFIVFIEALPLTPNGKVDRGALPPPKLSPQRPPRSSALADRMERTIAEIWSDLLAVEQVRVTDNFFDLGGHSLILNLVRARLTDTVGLEIPIIELFRRPTIRALAQYLTDGSAALPAHASERDATAVVGRSAGAERLRQLKRSRERARSMHST